MACKLQEAKGREALDSRLSAVSGVAGIACSDTPEAHPVAIDAHRFRATTSQSY
jgi:hypothetical protein